MFVQAINGRGIGGESGERQVLCPSLSNFQLARCYACESLDSLAKFMGARLSERPVDAPRGEQF
jgi:hypothetical protein